jgi:acetate kinase
MEKLLPAAKQVAAFDTSFHATIPKEAFLFGPNYECYAEHGIRRFGFHGPSHQFVFQRAAVMLAVAPEARNAVTCYIGGGVSIAAIRGGVSVDTSLGFGTAGGLPMGTRSGDGDPPASGKGRRPRRADQRGAAIARQALAVV